MYRLLNKRWNYGLPCQCLPGKKLRFLVYVFTLLDTILTPVFLPLITYAFYVKDQEARSVETVGQENRKKKRTLRKIRGLCKDQEAFLTRDDEIFPLFII